MSTFRIGVGYDLHRLVEGRPFTIGGVTIDFEKGPLGHSDGDALCHAIADAILGAASLGDLGLWFPSEDQSLSGASSLDILSKVGKSASEKGFYVSNIDSIVICEKPRLSPHYGQMQQSICKCLGLDPEQVSIKSKSNEKLGEIGSGDAIAAHAVVLLQKK